MTDAAALIAGYREEGISRIKLGVTDVPAQHTIAKT